MKSNWQRFKESINQRKNVYSFPIVVEVKDRTTNNMLYYNQEVAGYYDFTTNTIFVDAKYNCIALRFHERGHWINRLIFYSLEIFWEFIWWGLGLRKLFVRINADEKQIVVDIEVLDEEHCSETECCWSCYDSDCVEYCKLFGDLVGDENGLLRTIECKKRELAR